MIAFGVDCMWWDSLSNAGVSQTLMGDQLICPHCGGKCEMLPSEEMFFHMARRFETFGFVGHVNLIRWVRGRCYRNRHDAWKAYASAGLPTVV